MTIRIELELDMDAYNKMYGPGSKYAEEYGAQEHSEEDLEEMAREILEEGFYDWDCEGWMKLNVHN